jgi:hypothetical protein
MKWSQPLIIVGTNLRADPVACIIKEDGNRERPAQRHIGPNENNKTIIVEEGQPSFHIEPNQQKKKWKEIEPAQSIWNPLS